MVILFLSLFILCNFRLCDHIWTIPITLISLYSAGKIYWSVSTTNQDSKYFQEPEKFKPTRFENEVAQLLNIPFGGGPRVFPGKDYAKQLMFIHIHHVITLFQWQLINFKPKVLGNMHPLPVEGVRVCLESYAKEE